MTRALVVVLASLVLAPAAGAWTKLTGDTLQNIVDPSVVVLPDGTELIGYNEPVAGNLKLIRNGSTQALASGLPIVGDAAILPLSASSILLYSSGPSGVVRYASSDRGATWGPAQLTRSHDLGEVESVALTPSGTPMFSQDGTGFVNVFTGADGQSVVNAFPRCCGYAESLAVDTTGFAQIAFWSNATGEGGYLYGPVGGPYTNLTGGKESPSNDARVPLVADGLGNTFVAFQTGYPNADAFLVSTLRGGAVQSTVRFTGKYAQPDPHMALAVDASNRLWAVWTRQGAIWAARSRSHGAHFGAAVHVGEPGTVYQLEAGERSDGSVDVVANTGSNLQLQRLLPGLTAIVSRHGVRVLDDGFPVAGATVRAGARTYHTNAAGAVAATLKKGTLLRISAPGYTGASARVA